MMLGGQAIGIAAGTMLSGWASATLGITAAFVFTTALIGSTTVYVGVLRERDGEHSCRLAQAKSMLTITRCTPPPGVRSSRQPCGQRWSVSLVYIVVRLIVGFHMGVFSGMTPLLGADEVGWE